MIARVHIRPKHGVFDPQGQAVAQALRALGFGGVDDVKQGRLIELVLADTDAKQARASVEKMCSQLLANSVIEDYDINILAEDLKT
jgi:phosphoribosylformylglycinamidine synthase